MLDAMQIHRPSLPAAGAARTSFVVGQDGQGRWLAVETHGLGGGIFASRDGALRYARDESHGVPGAVRLAARPLRLFAS